MMTRGRILRVKVNMLREHEAILKRAKAEGDAWSIGYCESILANLKRDIEEMRADREWERKFLKALASGPCPR